MWIVNLLGLAAIALIVWWFWLYKPKEVVAAEEGVTVVVDNGTYQPTRIQLPANRPTKLTFLRKDASPCSETVVFPGLNISENLPLNQSKIVPLPPLAPGEYPFHCQMQMYRGVVHAK